MTVTLPDRDGVVRGHPHLIGQDIHELLLLSEQRNHPELRAIDDRDRSDVVTTSASTRTVVSIDEGSPDGRTMRPVSIVKINAITVPRERFGEFEQRFASRAGRVSAAPGFEGFELLRPNDQRDVCLVLTRWRSEGDFQAWAASPDFAAGHSQHRQQGPVGTASELWSFDVLEREAPARTTDAASARPTAQRMCHATDLPG